MLRRAAGNGEGPARPDHPLPSRLPGNRAQVNYSAARAGLQGLMETLVTELDLFSVMAR
jgi:NAD(P)-dependent dehydrogenase (short-subunit alcohol dehydrogenase family)